MNGSISPDPMRDIHNFRYSEITKNRDINNRDSVIYVSAQKNVLSNLPSLESSGSKIIS